MSSNYSGVRRAKWSARGTTLGALLVSLVTMTGCEGLLDVRLPGSVTVDVLDDPRIANVLYAGAVGDFECALASYTLTTGIISGVWEHASGLFQHILWGRRALADDNGDYGTASCASQLSLYTPLQSARYVAKDLQSRIEAWPANEVEDRTHKLAVLAILEGYSTQLLGEAFCETAIDGGPLVTRQEAFALAEAHFTRGLQLAQQAGADSTRYFALVGRARSRINQGKKAEAAADARLVPDGFIKLATRGDEEGRRRNKMVNLTNQSRAYSIRPEFQEVHWKGVLDPRVPTSATNTIRISSTRQMRVWIQDKYQTPVTPIPIARYAEAQLILAEAEGPAKAIEVINLLHARAGIPAFDPATDGDPMVHLIEERRRELFLEGQWINDLLRFGLPFPGGVDYTGLPYADPGLTCFPLPRSERNANPNIN